MTTRCFNAPCQPGVVMDLCCLGRAGCAPRCPRLGRICALAYGPGERRERNRPLAPLDPGGTDLKLDRAGMSLQACANS
jgi:hypothetical protein